MGSTLRTRGNPLGRQDSPVVQMGNLLCSRAIVLMLLCACKGIFWCLEQPSSSTMECHPLFQRLLRLTTVRRLSIRMSEFGAPTPKRTILYASYLKSFSWKVFGSELGVVMVQKKDGMYITNACKHGHLTPRICGFFYPSFIRGPRSQMHLADPRLHCARAIADTGNGGPIYQWIW